MNYVFQFGAVWQEFDKLLLGTWLTVRLSALTMVLGLGVGVLGALIVLVGGIVALVEMLQYLSSLRGH